MARPIIGLTTYREHARWGVWDEDVDLQSILYTDAIAASGGAVVLIPPAEMGVVDVLPALDGLVVSGGADVDPASYGATAHPEAGRFAVTATPPSSRCSRRRWPTAFRCSASAVARRCSTSHSGAIWSSICLMWQGYCRIKRPPVCSARGS